MFSGFPFCIANLVGWRTLQLVFPHVLVQERQFVFPQKAIRSMSPLVGLWVYLIHLEESCLRISFVFFRNFMFFRWLWCLVFYAVFCIWWSGKATILFGILKCSSENNFFEKKMLLHICLRIRWLVPYLYLEHYIYTLHCSIFIQHMLRIKIMKTIFLAEFV